MPISKYDRYFGSKKGSAQKAKSAMAEEYGADKGEKVFYATKNKRKGRKTVSKPSMKLGGMGIGLG
jgi:hypothetical protein